MQRIRRRGRSTQFLYAGDKLVGEYIGGSLTNRYVHGAGTDEPLVWYPGSTTTTRNWLHSDNQGSVIATSNTTGTVTPYQYGAYGEPNAWGGSRFRYTGQIMLPEVKLYYYKARAYDPLHGTFMQTDPAGYGDHLDLYEYVGDDPVNFDDPTGMVGAGVITGFEGEAGMGLMGSAIQGSIAWGLFHGKHGTSIALP